MLNRVILMGRITADPELKTTNTGVSVTSFSIAVDRNYVKQGEERKAVDMLTKIYGYYIDHVEEMPEEYVRIAGEDGDERAVCDYIAGMSDTYALKVFNHLFVPMFWHE